MQRSRKLLLIPAVMVLCLGLAACSNPANGNGNTNSNIPTLAQAKAKIELVGGASAHFTSGTNIDVQGMARNNDTFRHDVYFTATLYDANNKSLGTATGHIEDWKPGTAGVYNLTGTATSAGWVRVGVVVSNVKENTQGQGDN